MAKEYTTETYNVFDLETRRYEKVCFRVYPKKEEKKTVFTSIHPSGKRKSPQKQVKLTVC